MIRSLFATELGNLPTVAFYSLPFPSAISYCPSNTKSVMFSNVCYVHPKLLSPVCWGYLNMHFTFCIIRVDLEVEIVYVGDPGHVPLPL